jgi:hypothetical protein
MIVVRCGYACFWMLVELEVEEEGDSRHARGGVSGRRGHIILNEACSISITYK